MKKFIVILSLLISLIGFLGGQAAIDIFEEIDELERRSMNLDGPVVSPEYISSLSNQGAFVAFFSRALLFFGGFFFLYSFIDDLKKLLDKLKGRSEDSENIVKIEETYEQYQERKKKNREKQRKSIN